MRVREAKDFLVQQTEQQALLEGTPLSNLEKRMMYFTEGKDALEDPSTLNEEFEAQYDTTKYEKKINRLMSHAYSRVKRDDEEKLRQWKNAMGTLSRGDHYILVLWGRSTVHNAFQYWRVYVLIFVPVVALLLAAFFISPRRNGAGPLAGYLPAPSPAIEHVLQLLFLALLVAAFFFPKALAKFGARCLEPLFKWADDPNKEDDSTK